MLRTHLLARVLHPTKNGSRRYCFVARQVLSTHTWTTRDHLNPRSSRTALRSLTMQHSFAVRSSSSSFGSLHTAPEWYRPTFLKTASIEEKEFWLQSFLTSTEQRRTDEDIAAAYLVVLRALATSRQPGAPQRAEHWLLGFQKEHDTCNSAIVAECYHSALQAWLVADKEDPIVAIPRAERWFEELIQRHLVTNYSFYLLMDLCSKGRRRNKNDPTPLKRHAIKTQELLKRMHTLPGVHADTEAYNYVIRAWTRCRKDASIAERVMALMRQMELKGIKPNIKTYAMVMDAHAAVAKRKANLSLYRETPQAERLKNGLAELERMEKIFRQLQMQHEAGQTDFGPNTVLYNILITGWANVAAYLPSMAPTKAEEILRRMFVMKDKGVVHACPDSTSYRQVIRAWATSKRPNAGNRALFWLKKQWQDYEFEGDEKLLPCSNVYIEVLRTLAGCDMVAEAEEIMFELVKKFEKYHVNDLQPSTEAFAMVIGGWLNRAKKERCEASFRRGIEWMDMLLTQEAQQRGNDFSIATTHEMFLTALQAARAVSLQTRSHDVFELAISTFNKLRSSRHRLTCQAYSTLLEVGLIALARPEDDKARAKFLREIMKDCCGDGLISRDFVRALANGPVFYEGWTIEESDRVTRALFPKWPLPVSWTRNVRPDELLPKPRNAKRTHFQLRTHGHFQRPNSSQEQ